MPDDPEPPESIDFSVRVTPTLELLRRMRGRHYQTEIPLGHVEFVEVAEQARRAYFGAQAEPPLSKMERAILRNDSDRLQLRNPDPIERLLGWSRARRSVPTLEAQAALAAAKTREWAIAVQETAAADWLRHHGALSDWPDGRQIVCLTRGREIVEAHAGKSQTTPFSTTPPDEQVGHTWAKRPSNGLNYAKQDAPLIEEMRAMIQTGRARSPEDAARAVYRRAAGSSKEGSKVKRLARRYREKYPVQPFE
jgi:hypothetical protein